MVHPLAERFAAVTPRDCGADEQGWKILAVLGVGVVAAFLGAFFSVQAGLFLLAAAWLAVGTWRFPKMAFLFLLFVAPLLPILKATHVLSALTPLKDVVILALFVQTAVLPILTKRDPYRRNPVLLPLLSLLAWSVLAFLRSDDLVVGLLRFRDILLYVPLLWIARSFVATREDVRIVLRALLGSAAIVLALLGVQVLAFPDGMVLRFDPVREVWIPRVSSTLAHPNILGSFLLFSVPLAASLIPLARRARLHPAPERPGRQPGDEWREGDGVRCGVSPRAERRTRRCHPSAASSRSSGGRRHRGEALRGQPMGLQALGRTALVIAGAAAVFATYSRSAWIAHAVAVAALGALALRSRRAATMPRLLAGAVVLALLVAALPRARAMLRTVVDPTYASNRERLEILVGIAADTTNVEALIGRGLGDVTASTLRSVSVSLGDIAAADVRSVRTAKARTFVDNAVLKTWVEGGLVGVLLVAWLLWRVLRLAWRESAGGALPEGRAVARAVFAATAGLVALSLFLDVPEIFPVALLWWALVGVIEALPYLREEAPAARGGPP